MSLSSLIPAVSQNSDGSALLLACAHRMGVVPAAEVVCY